MKFKMIVGSILAATLGLGSIAFAKTGTYYPPERMHCGLNAGKLVCQDFNRQYLTEDTTNADFPDSTMQTFNFVSSAAYYAPSLDEVSVFFTYNNAKAKMVKLKTIVTSIRPDLSSGSWKKVHSDLYTCDEGYMSCGITNLPS
jgi:hypothetical protein